MPSFQNYWIVISHACIVLLLVWVAPLQISIFETPSKPELLSQRKQYSSVVSSSQSCIILHKKNGKAFQKICSFRVEDLVIDLYYWFKKSPKHKNTLKLFFSFYNQDYFSMMKQINTRWLTLELTLERCLLQYASL